jgi:hypothetical protein
MRGARAQTRLSFFVFGLCNEGVAGATDSALTSPISGVLRSYSGQKKVYSLPGANVSIAACAYLRLPFANQMAHEWPSPSSLVGRNPTFEEVVVAVQKQMASGEIRAKPHYDLALFSGSGPCFPQLATIHDGRIKYAAVGDVISGGYARSALGSRISERAPNNLVALRDLVIAASSRTLRTFGSHTVEGHRVISWPIYLYIRSWLGGSTTQPSIETIAETEGKPAERRHFARTEANPQSPWSIQLHAHLYDNFLGALESNDLLPEDITDVRWQPIKATIVTRTSAKDSSTTSEPAVSPDEAATDPLPSAT